MKHTFILLFISLLTVNVLAGSFTAVQTSSSNQTIEEQRPTTDQLVEIFSDAYKIKDWGKCLEVAQQLEQYGLSGVELSKKMRIKVYVASENWDFVDKYLNDIFDQLTDLQNRYLKFNSNSNHNIEEDKQVLKRMNRLLYKLDSQIQEVKLTRLQTLVDADKPDEYIAFSRSLMNGPDRNNHYLLDQIAWCIVGPDTDSEAEQDACTFRINGVAMFSPGPNGTHNRILAYQLRKHPKSFRTKEMLQLAKEAIDKAIQMEGGNNGAYYDTLGWAYYRLNNTKQASITERIAAKKTFEQNSILYNYIADWFLKKK